MRSHEKSPDWRGLECLLGQGQRVEAAGAGAQRDAVALERRVEQHLAGLAGAGRGPLLVLDRGRPLAQVHGGLGAGDARQQRIGRAERAVVVDDVAERAF